MVYSMIVRRKVRSTFDQINSGNYQAMVDGLGTPFEYVFHGEHALGGRRVSKEAMNRWWERTFRLLPGAKFDVREVLVNGGPWNTRIAVRSRVSGPLPDGERYENTVYQFMTLKWGKVVSVETVEDLQVLERALRAVADAGNEEAAAAPING
ncbi:MAG: polyketide cyclase [Candidatus Lumbricidophila eiseniae]|uniref:Polyketide cyclase n=1 Tax=Candidatus Lumbricidiphila eiseniae TaxID=1969409 RepID=A0A2A6FNW1_9MICO|nr:MAG: polyketide cyclase [Candidatus Lumbricidophila eiseniae]